MASVHLPRAQLSRALSAASTITLSGLVGDAPALCIAELSGYVATVNFGRGRLAARASTRTAIRCASAFTIVLLGKRHMRREAGQHDGHSSSTGDPKAAWCTGYYSRKRSRRHSPPFHRCPHYHRCLQCRRCHPSCLCHHSILQFQLSALLLMVLDSIRLAIDRGCSIVL